MQLNPLDSLRALVPLRLTLLTTGDRRLHTSDDAN